MLNIPADVVITKIKEQKGLSDSEIDMRIKTKLDQLAGLISREGAAHILANELGVNIFPKTGGRCKISEIVSGMRDVEIVGKVTAVYEIREFSRAESSGKVGNFMLGDETGTIRIVCWGNKADILTQLKEGMIIKIGSAYVRENQGRIELHCNDRTQVLPNPLGESVGEVKINTRELAMRKQICEFQETDTNIELLGTIIQVFDPRFFEICAKCQKRPKQIEGTLTCPDHPGPLTVDYSYVTNTIVDDGTGKIRVVFFRNQAQKLAEKNHESFLQYREDPGSFEEIKTNRLGDIIKITGRVQRNTMTAELELVSQLVFLNPNLEEEMRKEV